MRQIFLNFSIFELLRGSLRIGIGLLPALLLLTEAARAIETPSVTRIQGYHKGFPNTATVTVWGVGFGDPEVEVLGWAEKFDKEAALAALGRRTGKTPELLPEEPPSDAQSLPILGRDANGMTMAVRLMRKANQIVWVRKETGVSKPFLTRPPQPWFVYPDKATPGQSIRIFGRELRIRHKPALVALRSKETGTVYEMNPDRSRFHTQSIRNEAYEIDTVLPDDLQPGAYEILVHNGTGGAGAWSDPLPMEVSPPPSESPRQVLNARDFGAKGNGRTDDTAAIRKAIQACANQENAEVFLPPGRFIISGTIMLQEGTSLRGAGMGSTHLQVLKNNPMRNGYPLPEEHESYALDWVEMWNELGLNAAPMIWLRNRSSLSDLHLSHEYGAGVLMGVLVARAPGVAEGITIERTAYSLSRPETGHEHAVALMGYTRNLVLRDNHFIGGAVVARANWHVQPYIGHNTLKASQHGTHPWNMLFLRGVQEGIVEENTIIGGHRNFAMQRGPRWSKHETPVKGERLEVGPTRHLVFMGNVLREVAARRHNAGETMIENSAKESVLRYVRKAGDQSITLGGEAIARNHTGSHIVILAGRGLGQYRRVVGHREGNRLILDRPWDVVPDASTFVHLAPFAVEHLWLDNTEENIAGWTGFWGPNLGHIIDGHILRNGGGLYLWPFDEKTTVAFNEIRHSWLSGRSRIVLRGRGLLFGNHVSPGTEITDFGYRPGRGSNLAWAHPQDRKVLETRAAITGRAGVEIRGGTHPENLPEDVPFRAWNMIQQTLIHDGPTGIAVPEQARYTVLSRNVIGNVRVPIDDRGEETIRDGNVTGNE